MRRKGEGKMNQGKKKTVIINALIAVIILGMLFSMIRDTLPSAFAEIMTLRSSMVMIAIGCTLMFYISEGMTLSFLTRKNFSDYPWKHGIFCVFYTKLWAIVTLNVGATLGCMVHLSHDGIEYTQAFGLKTVHYVLHKLSVTFLSAMFALLFWNQLQSYRLQLLILICLILNIGLCLILILPCILPSLQKLILVILTKLDRKKKYEDKIEEFAQSLVHLEEGTKIMFEDKKLIAHAFIQTCLKCLFSFTINWACVQGSNDTFLLCLALTALEQMVASVIPNPTGVGSKEFMHLLLFSPYFGRAKAVSSMLLYQFFFNVVGFIFGLFASLELKVRKHRQIKTKSL